MLKRLLALCLVVSAAVLVLPGSAQAAPPTCVPPAVIVTHPDGTYGCTVPGNPGNPGEPGEPGDGTGGTSQPSCQIYGSYTYCLGNQPCRDVPWTPAMGQPPGPKPSPDSEPRARICGFPDPQTQGPIPYTIYWSGTEPEPPTLAEQAQTAIGEIDLALPPVLTSPPERTVVNFPTWFWMDGGSPELSGSSAFGLVAIATVARINVDPGDGSGGFTCPWVSSEEEASSSCTYDYKRDSSRGTATQDGRPAYEVGVSADWTVRFELGGNVIDIPGAPTTLDGPTSTTVLRVDQVQSINTPTH
ncbi:hypothetical protein [Nocardioides sp.]|uniref:hypothetical protein n=1 Tax=Nocardioides sp. TaxID=35761 RepID=UPI0027211273|nr:hypothetical protein [Nocardioides sp.]MDO9457666.1 hypothetical protein [Nocardioides sp.]